LAERRSPKPQVGGSIPSWPAKPFKKRNHMLTKNNFLWLLIGLLTISNFLFQFYVNLSSSLQLLVWVGWFALVLLTFMFTDVGLQLKNLLMDSYNEAKKVVWPTKQETIQTTMIVIIMVAVTGVILWLLDNVMIWLIAKLTHLG
jgi:preprotein translocase subunit SecE